MRALNTTQERKNAETIITKQIEALDASIDKAKSQHMLPLMMIKEDLEKRFEYLTSKKEWNFNFVGGGWNSVRAVDREEAIKLAVAEYNETEQRYHSPENGGAAIPLRKVDENTFRIATEADTRALLSLFY